MWAAEHNGKVAEIKGDVRPLFSHRSIQSRRDPSGPTRMADIFGFSVGESGVACRKNCVLHPPSMLLIIFEQSYA
jgi:hypothetical protein